MAKRTKEEIEESIIKFNSLTKVIAQILLAAIKWVGIILVCRYGYLAIVSLAGKTTIANILVSIITDLKMNQWFGLVFGTGGVSYGIVQKNLRKKEIRRLATRCDLLEKKVDPEKASSGLTHHGVHKEEDII